MPDLKTSFIPKQPIGVKKKETRPRVIGSLVFISLVIFFLTLAVSGGVYFYKALLERNIKTMSQSVERARRIIEPATVLILTRLDSRINATRVVLDNHTVVSPIFDLLEELTLQAVRFEQFRYSQGADRAELVLLGEAKDYSSLALQSDIFGENKYIEEPIFSDLGLNARGNVMFNLSIRINKNLLFYRNNLENANFTREQDEQL